MKITKTIRRAIGSAVEEHGTLESFAKRVGSSHQNIQRYLSGGIRSVTPKGFVKLYPAIKRYLNRDECDQVEFMARFELTPEQLKQLDIKPSAENIPGCGSIEESPLIGEIIRDLEENVDMYINATAGLPPKKSKELMRLLMKACIAKHVGKMKKDN